MAELLDCVRLCVPEEALEHYEAALGSVCRAVSFFQNEAERSWEIAGVKERGAKEPELAAALALAAMLTGISPEIGRELVEAGGWLARNQADFPEQLIGRRFAVRGAHIASPPARNRFTLVLDAGLAFGSGEHHSTRGCLLALERIVRHHRPRKLLDLGTGSGILAIAAGKLTRKTVLASDIDARAVRVARANARRNQVRLRALAANGWHNAVIRRQAPYDLVFANILARPLCGMAKRLETHLAPGGIAILAGLLTTQANWVLAAHRRCGLVLEGRVVDGAWSTLVFRKKSLF